MDNSLIELVAAQAGADSSLSNRRGWQYYDEQLTALRLNDVENIIKRGQVLIEAKDELEHGAFEAMVKRHFDLSYARKLRLIAGHPIISNRAHVHALPASVFTLYELTKLPNDVLLKRLSDRSINPKLERKQVAGWRKGEQAAVEVNGKAIDRRPSLAEQLQAAKLELAKALADNRNLRSADDGGNLFTADSSAEQIANSIAECIRSSPAKMRAVASRLNALAKDFETRIKTARPKKRRRA